MQGETCRALARWSLCFVVLMGASTARILAQESDEDVAAIADILGACLTRNSGQFMADQCLSPESRDQVLATLREMTGAEDVWVLRDFNFGLAQPEQAIHVQGEVATVSPVLLLFQASRFVSSRPYVLSLRKEEGVWKISGLERGRNVR